MAIQSCIENGLSAMMVIDAVDPSDSSHPLERSKVVGMITSRDILRIINAGFKDNENDQDIMERKVGKYMTPITQVIYARPEETIGMCRSIMAKLGVKCLPILNHGRVEGLVTSRDMNDYGLDAADRGGKKHYLESVSERVGLSSNTSMADPPSYLRAHLALQQKPLFMNVGVSELPHPFKTAASCGVSRRGEFRCVALRCTALYFMYSSFDDHEANSHNQFMPWSRFWTQRRSTGRITFGRCSLYCKCETS
jgi:CBS domain-containing protein